VTAGVFVTRYTPRVLLPGARDIITGFWTTAVFTINALIFVGVGIGFHQILSGLEMYSPWQLILYSGSVAVACIVVRLVWTFAQGLLPITNEPEHTGGKADWSHVMVLAWTGMRGGVSLAAALAIPLQTAAGPFPHRNLVIFITFVVLLATLVGQGGTLPLLIKLLRVTADSVDDDETRLALAETARAALRRIDELERNGDVPKPVADALRRRFKLRTAEFGDGDGKARQLTSLYRKIVVDVLQVERDELYELRRSGRIDNTILRRVQRLLDLETSEMDLLNATGRSDIED
jgi:CPA1 family monovalent cation:H+ antiporter